MSGTLQTLPASLTPAAREIQPFAWHGWRLRVPASWNPVALEGDFGKGHALLAESGEPRLGVRWRSVAAKEVTAEILRRAIRDEVGDEAAGHAKALPDPDTDADAPSNHLLCIDPNPPGRDVYVWHSVGERLVQLVYHATTRDDVLRREILPSLGDLSFMDTRPWAVLGLSCAVPAEMTLKAKRLNAGDLALEFADATRFVTVRQIALAHLALARAPLAAWLEEQQRARRQRYRADGGPANVAIETNDGRALFGIIGVMRRRRRFCWSWRVAREIVTLALHDATRDHLLLVEASDEPLARDVAKTVGCDIS